jgi:hypothetical protein
MPEEVSAADLAEVLQSLGTPMFTAPGKPGSWHMLTELQQQAWFTSARTRTVGTEFTTLNISHRSSAMSSDPPDMLGGVTPPPWLDDAAKAIIIVASLCAVIAVACWLFRVGC